MYDDFEDYTELLFQLDSEFGTDDYYILWGDCGVGNFFATKEQLRNLDFAECLYSWDCCSRFIKTQSSTFQIKGGYT